VTLHFLFLTSLFAHQPLGTEKQPLPDCGPVCVFVIMKLLDRPQSFSSVQARFRELNSDINLQYCSMQDLRLCLNSFGFKATSARVHRPEMTPTPSILYFEPPVEKNGTPDSTVGHFVVLKRIDKEQAEIIDWTLEPSVRSATLPISKLSQFWNGTVLIVSEREIHIDNELFSPFVLRVGVWTSAILLILAITFMVERMISWRSGRPSAKRDF
jgi:ABC-type bacteriocin/lantibiotic exporter with double-glycine peptidase domain